MAKHARIYLAHVLKSWEIDFSELSLQVMTDDLFYSRMFSIHFTIFGKSQNLVLTSTLALRLYITIQRGGRRSAGQSIIYKFYTKENIAIVQL